MRKEQSALGTKTKRKILGFSKGSIVGKLNGVDYILVTIHIKYPGPIAIVVPRLKTEKYFNGKKEKAKTGLCWP